MSETARAAVDHHADLAFDQTESRCNSRVVDVVDGLHFEEVVTRPEASDLADPAVEGQVLWIRGGQ